MKRLLLVAVAAAALDLAAEVGDTLRFALPGWVELELVEVGGSGKLPITYFYTGKDKDALDEVSFPKYWIGKFEVMQKQYQAVMGENPSSVKGERLPVTDMRWIDAVEFCDRLNRACVGDIPPGYRFDLPTIVEWAHAYCGCGDRPYRYAGADELDAVAWHGIEGKSGLVTFDKIHMVGLKRPNRINAYDMSGNVAESVFLIGARNSSMRVGGSFCWPERYCELCGISLSSTGRRFEDLGFRVALVPVAGRDPNGRTSAMCTKGKILHQAGYPGMARKYLEIAMGIKDLPAEELKRAKDAWNEADLACGWDIGNWHGLMTRITERMESAGYRLGDIMSFWDASRADPNYETLRKAVCSRYRKHRIYGMMVDKRELPSEIRAHFGRSTVEKVQAVSCDFSGDGLMDLVVELSGHAGMDGELYGFFERKRAGGYALVGEPMRAVGLCAIPGASRETLFIALFRRSDDVLAPGVIDCSIVAGKPCLRVAWVLDRSYCLKELASGKVHEKVSFMGKRNAVRTRYLAEGAYVRPLCWPWAR